MAEPIAAEVETAAADRGGVPERPTRQSASLKTTLAQLRRDRERLVTLLSKREDGVAVWGTFHPSFICVVLYRVSRYFHLKGHPLLARLAGHLNTFLTGADISPAADIAEGLVVMHPSGTGIYGKAGRNLTVMPCSGLGGEMGRHEDVGGGPGLPVVGDDVVLGPHGAVLGPCRVGDRVRIAGGVPVTRDVPDDTIVEGPRARFRRRSDVS